MSTITKERVTGIARGEKCYTHDDVVELARIALASLEAEPVACMVNGALYHSEEEARADARYILQPLYTAHPAPVSVPDEVSWEDVPEDITEDDIALASAWAHGFNQCRAAMLQGADGALTDEDTKRVDELVMWIKRLAHSLRKSNPDSKLQSDAMDYLSRKGLISVKDILR
ncbi:hypothetical protein [Escherichia coli]|uniref:hypothetical protein n=1 Tax=Escherichia coli TaxID=562 RepID=UPI0019B6423B|nr:hypothetical protein [Escherichia coli]CAD6028845.1 prophage protein [Escherichia coli]CAD6045504.1 prophage protein [Escherichia coli]CAD6133433.1 prophage protein [Escherichia coli]